MFYPKSSFVQADYRKKKAAQKRIRLQFKKKIFDAKQKGDLEEVKKLEFLLERL